MQEYREVFIGIEVVITLRVMTTGTKTRESLLSGAEVALSRIHH
jgi:hypothetical protein